MSGGIAERDPITGRILRGAGRAPKSDSEPGGAIDPTAATAGGTAPEPGNRPRRKPGRPRGSGGGGGGSRASEGTGKARAQKSASLDLSAFVGVWVGLHLQVAKLSGNPELAISEADGKSFLTAAQNVLRHYPVVASQRAIDWAAFAFVTSFIYVPRAVAIAQRRQHGETRQDAPGATVFQFHPPASGRSNGATPPSDFVEVPPIPPTVDGEAIPMAEPEYDA